MGIPEDDPRFNDEHAECRHEIDRLQVIIAKLPTEIEWLAIIDALEFTSTRCGCISNAHIRVVDKVKVLHKAAEVEVGGLK